MLDSKQYDLLFCAAKCRVKYSGVPEWNDKSELVDAKFQAMRHMGHFGKSMSPGDPAHRVNDFKTTIEMFVKWNCLNSTK